MIRDPMLHCFSIDFVIYFSFLFILFSALSYPSTMLTRSVNYLLKEMVQFVSFLSKFVGNSNYLVIRHLFNYFIFYRDKGHWAPFKNLNYKCEMRFLSLCMLLLLYLVTIFEFYSETNMWIITVYSTLQPGLSDLFTITQLLTISADHSTKWLIYNYTTSHGISGWSYKVTYLQLHNVSRY